MVLLFAINYVQRKKQNSVGILPVAKKPIHIPFQSPLHTRKVSIIYTSRRRPSDYQRELFTSGIPEQITNTLVLVAIVNVRSYT